jgi:hypothetical protein
VGAVASAVNVRDATLTRPPGEVDHTRNVCVPVVRAGVRYAVPHGTGGLLSSPQLSVVPAGSVEASRVNDAVAPVVAGDGPTATRVPPQATSS